MKVPAWITWEAIKRVSGMTARIVTRLWTRKQFERIQREKAEREKLRLVHPKKDTDK